MKRILVSILAASLTVIFTGVIFADDLMQDVIPSPEKKMEEMKEAPEKKMEEMKEAPEKKMEEMKEMEKK